MIGFALTFIAGMVACCFVPDRFQARVRGVAGLVWGRVSKRAPVPSSATVETLAATSAATRPAPQLTLEGVATGAGNLLGFFWRWKWVLLVLAAYLLASNLTGCSPFGLGKSRGELRLERELAEAEAETQAAVNARDAVIAQAARDAAIRRAQIRLESQRGQDEIAAATPENETPISPELSAAWRGAIERLRIYPSGEPAGDDPSGSGVTG